MSNIIKHKREQRTLTCDIDTHDNFQTKNLFITLQSDLASLRPVKFNTAFKGLQASLFRYPVKLVP